MADVPVPEPEGAAYQSLYRRYRPQRFADVRGQEHVTRALRNAVRDDRVSHAYLFSGPRGTGKTSTARILAMALNCAAPLDGEPDGTCDSCRAVRAGSSMDVHELDAASNRRIDEMRELLARVSLGTAGRWKVYIIDEVHQLTSDASSALLKTLEEPPPNVVFVLATTDPQRVLPTIRSRTQHFEFRLLGAEVLGELLRDVNQQADLGVAPEAIDLVVRRGHGSARDALSVLDQVAAAGEVDDETGPVGAIVDAVGDRDPGAVLVAMAEAVRAGRDPRRLAVDLLEYLRNGFLATQARSLVLLPDDDAAEVEAQARRIGVGGIVRALDVVGAALVDMRDAIEPRITLEAALVRLAAPSSDPADLRERIERIEQRLAGAPAVTAGPPPSGAPGPLPPAAAAAPAPAPAPAPESAAPAPAAPAAGPGPQTHAAPPADMHRRSPAAPPSPSRARTTADPPPMPGRPAPGRPDVAAGPATPRSAPPGASRPALGRRSSPSADPTPGAPGPSGPVAPEAAPPAPLTAGGGEGRADPPTRDELTLAWGDRVLPALKGALKAYVASGRFVRVDGSTAVFALPDRGLLSRAEPLRSQLESALAAEFGRPVPLRLIVDGEAAPVDAGAESDADEAADEDIGAEELAQLQDAGPGLVSPEQRLLEAFPGAEEVSP